MRKILLILIACILFLITFLSFNVTPQIQILHLFGYSLGINVVDYWYLRLAFFILFILLINDSENGSSK